MKAKKTKNKHQPYAQPQFSSYKKKVCLKIGRESCLKLIEDLLWITTIMQEYQNWEAQKGTSRMISTILKKTL